MRKYPNQKTKLPIKNPVSHIDVAPTILDLLNQPTPNDFQGKLLPLDDKQQSNVIVEWNGWTGSGGNFVCSQDARKDPYPEYLEKLSSKNAGLESLLQKYPTKKRQGNITASNICIELSEIVKQVENLLKI